jgi:hypothetical protein
MLPGPPGGVQVPLLLVGCTALKHTAGAQQAGWTLRLHDWPRGVQPGVGGDGGTLLSQKSIPGGTALLEHPPSSKLRLFVSVEKIFNKSLLFPQVGA